MVKFSLLIATTLFAFGGSAFSAESVEFKELAGCEDGHDPYGLDQIAIQRIEGALLVSGLVGLACGEHVVRPQLLPDWGSLTLAIETDSGGEPVAACRCTARVSFTLSQDVPSGRVIYLVKNGKGAAHAVAP